MEQQKGFSLSTTNTNLKAVSVALWFLDKWFHFFSILISLGYIFIFAFSSWPCPAIKGTPTPHTPSLALNILQASFHLFSHIQGSSQQSTSKPSHRTRSKATASKEEGGGEGGICSTCSLCSTTWKLLPARAASNSS
jgi:hypothetical protein